MSLSNTEYGLVPILQNKSGNLCLIHVRINLPLHMNYDNPLQSGGCYDEYSRVCIRLPMPREQPHEPNQQMRALDLTLNHGVSNSYCRNMPSISYFPLIAGLASKICKYEVFKLNKTIVSWRLYSTRSVSRCHFARACVIQPCRCDKANV